MDVLKNMIEKDALQESVAWMAEELARMYVQVALAPYFTDETKTLIGKGIDRVKFEIFPERYKTDEGKKELLQLKNRYQVQKHIIRRMDKWLRDETDTPVELIHKIEASLKAIYGIQ